MKTVQEVHKCPFCGSKDIEEIDRFTIHKHTSMYVTDERVDENGNNITIFATPIEQATRQKFRCNSCNSYFGTSDYSSDVETIRR